MPCRRRSGSTITCSRGPIRGRTATSWRTQSEFARSADRLPRGARAGLRADRRGGAVRAAGLFLRRILIRPWRLVFNRSVGLRDTWAKVQAGGDVDPSPAVTQNRTPDRF